MKSHRPSNDAVESTRHLWAELRAAAEDSTNPIARRLMRACATQATLSKFSCEEKKIRPLALNTLKAAAESAVEPGGWNKLDETRKALHLLNLSSKELRGKARRGASQRLSAAAEVNRTLEERNMNLLRSRIVLLQAYSDAIRLLKTFQDLDDNLAQQLRRHESMFDVRVIAKAEASNEQG